MTSLMSCQIISPWGVMVVMVSTQSWATVTLNLIIHEPQFELPRYATT